MRSAGFAGTNAVLSRRSSISASVMPRVAPKSFSMPRDPQKKFFILHSQKFGQARGAARRGCKDFTPLPGSSLFDRPPEAAVLASGFCIVAALAQRLPVALVPEECPVTFVRLDVIDDRGGDRPAMALAFGAQRMPAKVQGTCLAPSGVVPARCRRASTFVLLLSGRAQVPDAIPWHGKQSRTSRVPTRGRSGNSHDDQDSCKNNLIGSGNEAFM